MASNFVAINDWCHQVLREVARQVPLQVAPNGEVFCGTLAKPLPEQFYSLAACHTLDGLPLEQVRSGCWKVRDGCRGAVMQAVGGFEATRLDRRCWFDLRLQGVNPANAQALILGELLCFGAGSLRRAGIWNADGRLHTDLEHDFSRIVALRRHPAADDGMITKQAFDSTNVIYGDALGQLEQLWNRRAETDLLDALASNLQQFACWRDLPLSFNPPLNSAAVYSIHLKSQARWRVPPATGRALLRRVEWILENTILDNLAITVRSSINPRVWN